MKRQKAKTKELQMVRKERRQKGSGRGEIGESRWGEGAEEKRRGVIWGRDAMGEAYAH